MARAAPALTNFTAGELSPRLNGRTDLSKYFNGVSTLENFVVHPHGGVSRRPGTVFVNEAKDSSVKVRLVSFEFSTTQAYCLEFGALYFRIYKDGGVVTETAQNITAATKANPCVVTISSHGYSNGDHVVIASVAGMTQLNGRTYKVAGVTTNTFELDGIDSRDYSTYSSGGTAARIYTVTTTYTEAQLPALKFAQSADVMYVASPAHEPRKITRTDHNAWTIADVDFIRGPMGDANVTSTTLLAAAATGTPNVTASASLFASTDVGRLIRLHDGYVKITGFTSATVVATAVQENEDGRTELMPSYASDTIAFHEGDPSGTGLEHNDRITDSDKQFVIQGFETGMTITVTGAGTSANNADYLLVQVTEDTLLLSPSDDVVAEAASNTITIAGKLIASTDWALGAFSDTTGFPAAVTFYEQRLLFAGTTSQPQTLFFSQSGDFENFREGVNDADALTYTIGSNQVNVIRYLSAGRTLLVGTTGGEFAVRSAASDEPITPTNIQIKRQSTFGTADTQPIQIGPATLFLQRAKRKIRELVYSFDSDSYQAPDLTLLAEHISENGLTEIAYQQEPDSVLWAVRGDGQLLGMTYRREEDVVAWHRHTIGGTYTGTHGSLASATYTHGMVESVAVIPGDLTTTAGDEDQVWVSVKRTVDVPLLYSAAADTANNRINSVNHGLSTGTAITFVTNGIAPTGAQAGDSTNLFKADGATVYYARNVSTDVFAIFIDSAGAIADTDANKITFSDAGTGTMTVYAQTRTTATKRYIEYFNVSDFGTDKEDAYFVDSGLTYTGSAATTLSGLEHLRGHDVAILANGATHPTKHITADPSAIVLERTTTKAHIGLPFTSTLTTMRIEAGDTQGTAQGKTKRIHNIVVRLFRTVGIKVGSSITVKDLIPFRTSADEMDQALDLFTGDKTVEFRGDYDNDGYICVQQDQPLPATVVAIYPELNTNET